MMENINELKTQSLPMSVDGIVEKIEQLSKESIQRVKNMKNDPIIIAAKNEYEMRKQNGEFLDEDR